MPTELTLRAVLLSPLGSFTRAGDNVPGHGAAHDSGLRVKVTHDRPTVWTVLWGLDEATRSTAQDFHLLGKSSQQKGVKNSFKICAKIKKNQPFCTKFQAEIHVKLRNYMSRHGTSISKSL